jgi:hypothetical protein
MRREISSVETRAILPMSRLPGMGSNSFDQPNDETNDYECADDSVSKHVAPPSLRGTILIGSPSMWNTAQVVVKALSGLTRHRVGLWPELKSDLR